MNITNIPASADDVHAAVSDIAAAADSASSTGFSYHIYVVVIVAIITILFLLKRGTSKNSKKEIAIVGERGAGKTQLFIGLNKGKSLETVPSIVNNVSTIELGRKKYTLCDFIGDNLSKDEVVGEIVRFHTLVHVVDGTDSKKLGDAALFIYRVLVNKQFQKERCNYILLFNKSDLSTFHGQEKLAKRIEDEIETIKATRRNETDEN